MLWTMKTSVFYWWPFELTTIPWRDAKTHCYAVHHLMLQHNNAARKLKMSQFLHGQLAHQTCHPLGIFRCSLSTACSSSSHLYQYTANLHSHPKGVDHDSKGHNHIIKELYRKDLRCTVWGKWWPDFCTPTAYRKTAHFKAINCHRPLIGGNLRITCIIIMLSDQRLDM